MSDRGMKKWNAYKSLPEHGDALNDEFESKKKIDKPLISSEEAEIINEILVMYHGEELIITYYRNGYLYEIKDILKKIDPYERRIITIKHGNILFKEIVKLKIND